ncbi:MAG: hypothetical protein R3C05_26965 [Pirellulaceae bacterium]
MFDDKRIATNETFFQRLAHRGGAEAWAEYQQLEHSQWWTAREMEEHQFSRLRGMLIHCERYVPYYRKTFAASGISANEVSSMLDMRQLPIVDRLDYAMSTESMKATDLPPGNWRTGIMSTSGTTGIPVRIDQTNVLRRVWTALALRDLRWSDLDPRRTLASIRPTGASGRDLETLLAGATLSNWGTSLATVIETGPSHVMDMTADPRHQLRWLRKVDADYLLSFPSNVEHLARLARQQGITLPNLKRIQTIGEVLLPEVRELIEEVFNVAVVDTYSCCEAGYVASPCPDGHGYHVHAENVIVEVLDEHDRPCVEGQTGRIVLTTLHNFATPFIRYDIHDWATVGARNCPCGRGLPLLSEIFGRRRPMFRLPDGSEKSSSPLAQQLRKVGGFLQFQVEQSHRDRVVLRVVPDNRWSPARRETLQSTLDRFFGPSVHCEINCVQVIESSQGQKLQSTIVSPSVDDAPINSNFRVAEQAGQQMTNDAKNLGRAIVYACSDVSHIPQTTSSARSAREHMPAVPCFLWATPNIDLSQLPTELFSELRPTHGILHSHRPRFESMLQCTAERALFLDGDTLITEPVNELFDLLDHFDIALAAAPQYLHSEAIQMRIYEKLPAVSTALPEWNGGVIAARVSDPFREFVNRWIEMFAICRRHGYHMDQAALRVALATSDLRIATLPTNYNFRPMMPQAIKGNAKIIHAHGDLSTIANIVNRTSNPRVWNPQ